MNKVLGVKINKQLENLVKERVTIVDKPYEFMITGVTGFGHSLMDTAHSTYEKLKKWVEREGGEIKIIEDRYETILKDSLTNKTLYSSYKQAESKGQSKGYILIEVTDPCSKIVEELIRRDN